MLKKRKENVCPIAIIWNWINSNCFIFLFFKSKHRPYCCISSWRWLCFLGFFWMFCIKLNQIKIHQSVADTLQLCRLPPFPTKLVYHFRWWLDHQNGTGLLALIDPKTMTKKKKTKKKTHFPIRQWSIGQLFWFFFFFRSSILSNSNQNKNANYLQRDRSMRSSVFLKVCGVLF